MNLTIIAAVSTNGIIGIDDKIPWYVPEDFKHFKATTINNTVVVGYNTYLTLPEKAFDNRKYVVLNSSSNKHWDVLREGVIQFNDINSLLEHLDYLQNVEKVYIAGGAMLYERLIDYCDQAIITWVDKIYENGNKMFPIDKLFTNFDGEINQDWELSKSGLKYKITKYYRK